MVKININGTIFTIRTGTFRNENTFGETDYHDHTIKLDTTLDNVELKETLKHELMHGYLYSIGLMNRTTFELDEMCEIYAKIQNCITEKTVDEIMKKLIKERKQNEKEN